MLKPTVSKHEKQRLEALYKLDILDSDAEERFDRLTRLIADYFNVKICLVSLVDVDRQWFKSKSGLDACETHRDISFCGHAILQNEVMIIPDARLDHRFADNPLVTDPPNIVFYAGAPLSTTDGYKVGTLCLIDDKPHMLDARQLKALRDLADIVEQELTDLTQKQLQKERNDANIRTNHMLEVFPDIVFIFDNKFKYIASNDHRDLFLPREHFIEKTLAEVLPEDISNLYERSLIQAFETGELVTFHYEFMKDGSNYSFEARARRISETEVFVIVRNASEEVAQINELERLSMVAQQTTNAVIITDKDKKVLWVNESFTKISGYSIEEIKGKVPGQLLQGLDTEPDTIQTMRKALNAQRSYKVDIINYHKAGYPYWVRIVCNPWLDETGEVKGYIAIQSDINQEVQNLEQIKKSQQLLSAVIDANSIGTWILNLQTGELTLNENWATLIGYSLKELEPISMDTWIKLTHADDVTKCLKILDENDQGLINYYEASIRMKHKAGHWVWIRTRGSITSRTEDGKAEYLLGTHIDITAQKHAEADLQEQYDYMQVIIDNMIDGIVIINFQDDIQLFNPTSEQMFGYLRDEILNQNINLVIPKFQRTQLVGQLQYAEGRRKNGDIFPMEIGIVETKYKQETIFVAMLRDVTERKIAEEAIHKLAYFDGLSGLANRRLMFDRLQQALLKCERTKNHVAILFIDFDNFKQLNDSAGHDVGDMLLQTISERLLMSVREGDTVARLGGDEFVVILENLDESIERASCHADAAAQKIKAEVNEPYQLKDINYTGSCCIGISLSDDPSISVTEFLKQADLAMYQAKLIGKNAVRFFAEEMQEKVNRRIKIEQDLRNAISREEFEVLYQPQVDSEGSYTGAEALLRWHHPQGGLVSPMEFIPIAEESGLIVPIGQWVLSQACACLVNWADKPLMSDMVVAINVSVIELAKDDWVESVLKTVDFTGINPARLKLEITESVMAFEIEKIISKLSILRDTGISIALDDFGTGYSSLSYLKRLPLNELKIDKCFIEDIMVDQSDLAIAETIIHLANMMQLDVIAEGIETQEQYSLLRDLGCRKFQGYLFSKPIPVESFEKNCLLLSENLYV